MGHVDLYSVARAPWSRPCTRLFLVRGTPEHLRSDNGPEFIAHAVQVWLQDHGCAAVYITPGSVWKNPFIEGFNGTFRAGCLNRYPFAHGREAQHIVEQYRIEYTAVRPQSALGHLTPAESARQHVVLSL